MERNWFISSLMSSILKEAAKTSAENEETRQLSEERALRGAVNV